jgi:hypothetical protein
MADEAVDAEDQDFFHGVCPQAMEIAESKG